MAFVNAGRTITRSTWCRPAWRVQVTIACADRVPNRRASHLFLGLEWRDGVQGTTTLRFERQVTATGGELRFDGFDGPTERVFTGDVRQLVPVFGRSLTVGGEPDVNLVIEAEGEQVTSIPLSIGLPAVSVAIRSEDGSAVLVARPTEPIRLRAVAVPSTQGSYRWITVAPDLLRMGDGEGGEIVEVVPEGREDAARALAVLFTPAGGGADALGVHIFGGSLQVESAFWARDLQPIGGTAVRPGQLVEMFGTVTNPGFRLDGESRLRWFLLEDDNSLGSRDERVVAFLGSGATAGARSFRTVERRTTIRRLEPGQRVAEAIAAFRAERPADFHEHFLVLEESGMSHGYHLLGWWRAERIGSDFRPASYFVIELGDERLRISGSTAEVLEVSGTPVDAPEVPRRIRLRLTGRLLDASPLVAATPEPLGGVPVRISGETVRSGDDGRFALEALVIHGTQTLEITRSGMETIALTVAVTTGAEGVITIRVHGGEADVEYVRVQHAGAVDDRIPVAVPLTDIPARVHKIRGVVEWPDSRTVDDPAYTGTPLSNRRVYALPVPADELGSARPTTSRAWAALKQRAEALLSTRPGRPAQRERTAADGAFEIRFADLSVGARFLLWVESPDPAEIANLDASVESPEYCVRTHYAELLELTGSRANLTAEVGRHLVDHTHNLTTASIAWGLESLKVVEQGADPGEVAIRALRPRRGERGPFDTTDEGGEEVPGYDAVEHMLEGVRLQVLPIVPVFEAPDSRSERAGIAADALAAAMDTPHPRGHFADAVRFVLDGERLQTGIDLSTGTWDGAWAPGDPTGSSQRRTCELLEKTSLLSPGIPSAHLAGVEAARWRFDAATLADHALIETSTPAAGPLIANRRLTDPWVPLLHAAVPRLLGLAAGRHIYLAPGHGFYDASPPSANAADWASQRGGYNNRSGEDENVGYLSAEVDRIARRQGASVSSAREIRDFTRPGVTHPAHDVFNPVADADFLRLWQQNPIYFLGLEGDAVVIGTALGNLAGDHNSKGITARRELAGALAGAADPMDIMLSVHTNAFNAVARGVSAFYLDVDVATGDNSEFNTFSEGYSTRLRDTLVNRCHMIHRNVLSVRAHGGGNSDLQNTFDYWTRNTGGSSATWPRVRNAPVPVAGWAHRTFPATIPVSLVEVGFHDSPEDGGLLSRAWFRRTAAEALTMATEAQIRDVAAPITRSDAVRLLLASFGRTDPIVGLVDDDTQIDGDLGDYVQAATGAASAPAANDLDAAVIAIETARNAFTRSDLVGAITAALAEVAGYDAGDAGEIDAFVAALVLGGSGIAGLRRPHAAPTRQDAGRFVARGLGWTPENLETASTRAVDGTILLPPLGGDPAGEAYLPRVESDGLVARLRAIPPERLYRVRELYLATEAGVRLPTAADGSYALRTGMRITLVAETDGVPWAADPEALRFTVTGLTTPVDVPAAERLPGRLRSAAWEYAEISNQSRTVGIAVSVVHAALGKRRLKSEQIRTFALF